MNAKKKIEVNSSSLVGLKAELFRKQEALRRDRLQQHSTTIKAKPTTKKPSIWNKKNAGVQSRAEKDRGLVQEDENKLDKSRAMLEAKTKLYDQMSQGVKLSEDDVAGQYLVDFEKKAIDEIEKRRHDDETRMKSRDEDEETEYEMGETDVPGPVHPEEEWIDYVDTLGRSRRCMKKDLPELMNMDKKLNPQAFKEKEDEIKAKESLPDLLSNDMYREIMRKKWEAEEEDMRSRGSGSVHYQNLRFDEVREMGVGYFGFSKEEGERQKQMEMLDHLRDQTVDQRSKSDQLKAKRKAILQARLEKVKQRKRLKGELVEEEADKKDEGDDREEEEVARRQRDVEQMRVADRINKTAPVRPWDIGKEESQWEKVKRQVREERPREFAPPQLYSGAKMTASVSGSDTQYPGKNEFSSSGGYGNVDRERDASKASLAFPPPNDYGSDGQTKWNSRGEDDRGAGRLSAHSNRKELKGVSLDDGRHGGVSVREQPGAGKSTVSEDTIAQALAFFRHNAKK